MSSRRYTTDERFAEILEEDFGISAGTIMQALGGEPQKQAIKVLSWAERIDDPARALLAWSRKHRKGTHRPRRRSCGQRQERQRDGYGRRAGNREGRRRSSDTPGDGSVAWGYGAGRETVLAGLDRLAD